MHLSRPLFNYITTLFLFFLSSNLIAQGNYVAYTSSIIPTFTDAEIRQRLNTIDNRVIQPRFTPIVRSYINTYTVRKRDKAEYILGRIPMYFPLFEKYLKENNLPTDLKYLAIVESALNPEALSRSGAGGLWQFMPGTGKEMGLKINRTVDERSDPHKATLAACKYLQQLYDRYHDWELALAAYNSGPGKVNRAIKRSRSRNFWKLKRFLPRETRNYVPAFIAACYLVQHYDKHNLTAIQMPRDMVLTETTKVYDRVTFSEINSITGTPMHVLETLNPSYKRGIIKGSYTGDYLTLPYDRIGTFLQYYRNADNPTSNFSSKYDGGIKTIVVENTPNQSLRHTIQPRETLYGIARKHNCSVAELRRWNQLQSDRLLVGSALLIQKSNPRIKLKPSRKPYIPFQKLPLHPIRLVDKFDAKKKPIKQKNASSEFSSHTLKRGETLLEVAGQYGVSLSELLSQNEGLELHKIKAGQVILLKK